MTTNASDSVTASSDEAPCSRLSIRKPSCENRTVNALERTRTSTGLTPTCPSSMRVYQFHHQSRCVCTRRREHGTRKGTGRASLVQAYCVDFSPMLLRSSKPIERGRCIVRMALQILAAANRISQTTPHVIKLKIRKCSTPPIPADDLLVASANSDS